MRPQGAAVILLALAALGESRSISNALHSLVNRVKRQAGFRSTTRISRGRGGGGGGTIVSEESVGGAMYGGGGRGGFGDSQGSYQYSYESTGFYGTGEGGGGGGGGGGRRGGAKGFMKKRGSFRSGGGAAGFEGETVIYGDYEYAYVPEFGYTYDYRESRIPDYRYAYYTQAPVKLKKKIRRAKQQVIKNKIKTTPRPTTTTTPPANFSLDYKLNAQDMSVLSRGYVLVPRTIGVPALQWMWETQYQPYGKWQTVGSQTIYGQQGQSTWGSGTGMTGMTSRTSYGLGGMGSTGSGLGSGNSYTSSWGSSRTYNPWSYMGRGYGLYSGRPSSTYSGTSYTGTGSSSYGGTSSLGTAPSLSSYMTSSGSLSGSMPMSTASLNALAGRLGSYNQVGKWEWHSDVNMNDPKIMEIKNFLVQLMNSPNAPARRSGVIPLGDINSQSSVITADGTARFRGTIEASDTSGLIGQDHQFGTASDALLRSLGQRLAGSSSFMGSSLGSSGISGFGSKTKNKKTKKT